MTEAQRKLWTEMLNSELSSEYFACIASRSARWDFTSKWFLAAMSSGTVAGWAFWHDEVQHPVMSVVWKILSAIAALTSIALSIVNLAKKVEWATTLKNGFRAAADEYEHVWLKRHQLSDDDLLKQTRTIKERESSLQALESHFPVRNERLLRKCQETINRRRNITK